MVNDTVVSQILAAGGQFVQPYINAVRQHHAHMQPLFEKYHHRAYSQGRYGARMSWFIGKATFRQPGTLDVTNYMTPEERRGENELLAAEYRCWRPLYNAFHQAARSSGLPAESKDQRERLEQQSGSITAERVVNALTGSIAALSIGREPLRSAIPVTLSPTWRAEHFAR